METNSQPIPLNAQPSEKKIKVSYIVFVLLAVLVTVGSFFAGYQVGKNNQNPTSTEKIVTPETKSTNWKTYTNSELGFSLQYPENWYKEVQGTQKDKSVRFQNYDPTNAPGRSYDPGADKGMWEFVISKRNFSSPPKDISQLKLEIEQPDSDCGYMGDPAGKLVITNEKEGSIDDYLTYSREEKCSQLPDSTKSEYTYILGTNGEVLEINRIMDYKGQDELFNQVISSIKFINTTPTSTNTQKPIDSWIDYTNTSLKISFKHPSNWTIRGYAGDQENYQNNTNTYTSFILSSPDDSISIDIRNQVFEGAIDQCMASEEIKEINLDGVPYKMETYTSECESDVNDSKISFLTSTTKKVNMAFNYSRTNSTTTESTRDQLISTIRFTK